jgi:hypothetical protein
MSGLSNNMYAPYMVILSKNLTANEDEEQKL